MQIRMDEKGRILFMATYVISDIHGEYERFMELLEEIELKDTDTLYVLGDVLDQLNQLQSQVDSLNETTASAQQQIQTAQDTAASYENLLKAVEAQQQGNTSNATNALTEVNPEVLSVDAKAVYDTIYKSMQSSMFQELSQSGVNAFDDANYTEAIDKLSKAKNINDSDYTVLNYLAHAYRLSGDTDNAISVFQEIIDKFPGTQKATKAEQQIEALGGTVKTEE